jgi:ABC-type transport system involved in multi-copper enzyme maturation permease subunit
VGPLLAYDLVRTARRKSFHWLRIFYAAFLLVAFFFVYFGWAYGRSAALNQLFAWPRLSSQAMADFASTFYLAFLVIQFLAACLLTPAFTAGAIPEDKACRTLEFLLTTDLRNREIILSLALSRLANLGLLFLTGLPILSIMLLLGGVDPHVLLAGFELTACVMISLTSLGFLLSLYCHHPRQAVMRTYLLALGYLVLSGMSWLLLNPTMGIAGFPSSIYPETPLTLEDLVVGFNTGNPIAMLVLLWLSFAPMVSFDTLLSSAVADFAIFHGMVTLLCISWAILRLRFVLLREPPGLVNNALPLTQWRLRPRIGNHPLVWKELFTDQGHRSGRLARITKGVLFPASFVPVLAIYWFYGFRVTLEPELLENLNVWVRLMTALLASGLLVGVAARAAGCLSGEHDRQTLDGLLATPNRSAAILGAKWLGSMLHNRSGWLWLGLVWCVGIASGSLDWRFVPVLVTAWFVVACFAASLGLWFSAGRTNAQRAIRGTLLCLLAFGIGHWLVWFVIFPVIRVLKGGMPFLPEMTEWQALGMTPPVTFMFLAFGAEGSVTWVWVDWQWAFAPLLRGAAFWILGSALFGALALARFQANYRPSAPSHSETLARYRYSGMQALKVALAAALFMVAWTLTAPFTSESQYQQVAAETDRLDPGWRQDELEARRRIVADSENAGLQVPLVPDERKLRLTPPWFPGKTWPSPKLYELLKDLDPHLQLTPEQYRELKANLDAVQPALAQARKLVDFSYGRYPLEYRKNPFYTLLPFAQRNRTIAELLSYDALLRAHQGSADFALVSCRAGINAGRSLGDEPFLISQLVHVACRGLILPKVERTLAQGQASEGKLAALQKLLELEEKEPLLLRGTRSERASFDRYCEAIEEGELSINELRYPLGEPTGISLVNSFFLLIGISVQAERAALLRFSNRMVELAKLEPRDQLAQKAALQKERQVLLLPLGRGLLGKLERTFWFPRMIDSFTRALALLRSSIIMLAVERYRLAHHDWPGSLEDLVPAFLAAVPKDPYTSLPFRFRRLPDGVVIYSVGPDGQDDGGRIDRENIKLKLDPATARGWDVGVRLWDVHERRQPPGSPQ